MNTKKFLTTFFIGLLLLLLTACGSANNDTTEENQTETENKSEEQSEQPAEVKDLILSTTTSTQDSGLLDVLIPIFEEQHPYNVKPIAVGTGQALEMGVNGEADVLLTHAPASEQVLVDAGDVINYKRVMYNDFIIVGPSSDPAGIKGLEVAEAFQKVFDSSAAFASRGDDSGTHKKELGIWESLNITPSENEDYLETGQGMGNTLQLAAEKQAYLLTDRATYLAQADNLADMEIVVEGDEALLNIYHVMQVNPDKSDIINSAGAEAFVEFMISDETQSIIEEFGKEEYGQPLFFPYTE